MRETIRDDDLVYWEAEPATAGYLLGLSVPPLGILGLVIVLSLYLPPFTSGLVIGAVIGAAFVLFKTDPHLKATVQRIGRWAP